VPYLSALEVSHDKALYKSTDTYTQLYIHQRTAFDCFPRLRGLGTTAAFAGGPAVYQSASPTTVMVCIYAGIRSAGRNLFELGIL